MPLTALIPIAALVTALQGRTMPPPGVRAVEQDTTRRDTSAGSVANPKKKHTVAYNVGHSLKKAGKDTKNAVSKGATDTQHELGRAGKNTRNEIHRDATRVGKATDKSDKEKQKEKQKQEQKQEQKEEQRDSVAPKG